MHPIVLPGNFGLAPDVGQTPHTVYVALRGNTPGVQPPYHLTVVGAGYLGTTQAACMAELGYEVLALDTDTDRVARLSAGDLPFHEPELGEALRRGLGSGRLRFTTSYEAVAEFGDVHFLCVGTPQQESEYAADLSQVEGAVASLAPLLRRECLVVGRSTVPVGTATRLAKELHRLAPVEEGAELAWNPEFLREGYAVHDNLHPNRIVAGVASEAAERVLREIYESMAAEGIQFLVTDYATAELAKVAANAFLATKISFINVMSEVCEAAHGDVGKLSEVLSYDDRIGAKAMGAGLGFGGGCLPKDIRAFMARAGELGVDQALTFLKEVDDINTWRRTRMVETTREMLGGSLAGCRVGALGAAFKPDSDDIRDSPALDVAAAIRAQGGIVTVYDPAALPSAQDAYPQLEYARSAYEAVRDAHVVLHLTEWPEFRELDPVEVGRVVAQRMVVDGRGALDAARWRDAGWHFRALGRR